MAFPNKFPKACAKCNQLVPAYQGVCEKVNDKWLVEHVDCHAPMVEKKQQEEDLLNHPAFAPLDAFHWMEDDFEQGTF